MRPDKFAVGYSPVLPKSEGTPARWRTHRVPGPDYPVE